ncbi:hypothetical protein ACJVC5_03610 [Peredibacter sp. HCB2-198]|uniref:hypothetical protein n=1 Tax=Peredibacter sp. HCB2-198 TaxID=3383025 RepID=UPI0038B42B3B
MKNILLFTLFFSAFSSFAQTIKFRKLTCYSLDQKAKIGVIFPKLIDPMNPFIGFPEIWVQVTVEKEGMNWVYQRDRVLIIPEFYPPGVEMRGQSSDSLYIKLHPEIRFNKYTGTYYGQLFVNDHESDRRAYFRYMDSELGPGLSCTSQE